MANTGTWRVKGVDRKTRRMARDAAARSGMPIGVWIDRAIKSRAGIAPRGDAKPLVPPELLKSARVVEPENSATKESFPAGAPDTADRPSLPRINPVIAAPESRPLTGMTGRIAGGVLIVALMAGGYWLVSRGPLSTPASGPKSTAAGTDGASTPQETSVAAVPPAEPVTPVQKLTAAANRGDAVAQRDLGLRYLQGDGVPKNPAVGAQWLEKSAAAGTPEAQYRLGVLYEKGLGVPQDDRTAFTWYRRAALQGHVRAQQHLGTLYEEGRGTKRDYAEAAHWFTRASKGGLAEAHYSLGMMYEQGLGVEKDPRKAAEYYRGALAAGSARAAEKLARLEPALQEAPAQPEAAPGPDVGGAGSDAAAAADSGHALTPAGIVNLQRLLAKLDLEPGPADGVLGDQTIQAIKLYQRFAGLPVDGKPTIGLLRDLRQVVSAMTAEAPESQTKTTPHAAP